MNGYEMLFLAQTLITLYSSTYKRITKKTCMRTRLVCHKNPTNVILSYLQENYIENMYEN